MKLLASLMLAALLFALAVPAQVNNQATNGIKHFEKADLAFDFPAEWKLTDNSVDDVQRITISTEDGAAQIAVVVQLGNDDPCDFQAASKVTTNNWLEHIATQIHAARPLQTSPVKVHIGASDIDGLQFRGLMNNRSVTSEIYSLRLNQHFVSLAYLRVDDDTRGQSAWESVRKTLTLAKPVKTLAVQPGVPGSPKILNGRAVHLAQPQYPDSARWSRATGIVAVQVQIDKTGKVVSAQAISGPQQLQAASVAAARASKFAPTVLCGEPVPVNGVLQYSFVAR